MVEVQSTEAKIGAWEAFGNLMLNETSSPPTLITIVIMYRKLLFTLLCLEVLMRNPFVPQAPCCQAPNCLLCPSSCHESASFEQLLYSLA